MHGIVPARNGEALRFLRMRDTLYGRAELTAPRRLALSAVTNCLMSHVVT